MASRRALTGVDAPNAEAIATILTTSGTTGRPRARCSRTAWRFSPGKGSRTGSGSAPMIASSLCLLSHINARFYLRRSARSRRAHRSLEERFSASRFWSSSARRRGDASQRDRRDAQDPPRSTGNGRGARTRAATRLRGPGAGAYWRISSSSGGSARGSDRLRADREHVRVHPARGGRARPRRDGMPRRHPDPFAPSEVRLVDGEIRLAQSRDAFGLLRGCRRDSRGRDRRRVAQDRDLATRNADGSRTFVGRRSSRDPPARRDGLPGEVEAALEAHPAVLEAGVRGVPSPLGEDDVMAYVVLRQADDRERGRSRRALRPAPRVLSRCRHAGASSTLSPHRHPARRLPPCWNRDTP